MEILVTYDVATDTAEGRSRLRRVANVCISHGQRVQDSVFECSLNEMQLVRLQSKLLKIIDEKEDSLRIYRLLEPREKYTRCFGIDKRIDFQGPLVV